jgi:hypothetical protein
MELRLPFRLRFHEHIRNLSGKPAQVYLFAFHLRAGHAGQVQQIVNEPAHPLRSGDYPLKGIPAFSVEFVRVVFKQRLAESCNAPEGRAQVMGHGIAEGLKLPVGGFELQEMMFQLFVRR